MRHFLGVCNFIKNHIPGQAALIEPITRLTKKDFRFAWEEEQDTAFKLIKKKVAEAIILTYPDLAKTFHVYPDASSKFAMGAVLVQNGKVISTFSRKFNDAQLKYTVTDQEPLAVLEACTHFKKFIHSWDITVHTNHKNLTFDTAQRSNAHVERSLILLQKEFRVKLEHIPGEENMAADGLSRLAFDENLAVNNTIFATQMIDEEDSHMCPLDMHHIGQKQLTNKPLQR